MSLQARIEADLKTAMIARDAARLSTLRFLKSALKYAAIEKKTEGLADADILQVIRKQIKQRRESIEQFKGGGRADLAEKEAAELAVLESYLPQQLSDDELKSFVESKVKEAGAVSKKDFGRTMKLLNDALAGQADAKRISQFLTELLP